VSYTPSSPLNSPLQDTLKGLANPEAMSAALSRAGLSAELSQEQATRVARFFLTRAQWSKTHNLSGPQALEVLSTDLVDAVAVAAVLDPLLPLSDVGSGSGVPGMLVACLEPSRSVRLVEPLAKRCAFLRTVSHQLGLSEVKVYRDKWPCAAVEALGPTQVVSRAVVSPEAWPQLAQGPQSAHIIQMLAHLRPEWPLEGYQLASEVSYTVHGGGERLVRRWAKVKG
jgi:16S rRNA G527 N7-methylase RsmG